MPLVDRLAYTNRWRRRHPADKLALAAGLLLLSLLLPPLPAAPLIVAAAATAAVAGAGVRAADFARLLLLPAAFLASSGAVLAVGVDFAAGGPTLSVSAAGIERAVSVSLRALAATAALTLLIVTTPALDLLALMRRAGVPAALIDIAHLIYRLAAIALEIAVRSWCAQASRLGHAGLRRSVRSTGLLAATLLVRVLDHARRMEIGLAARGYDGELRTLPPAQAPSPAFIGGAVALHGALSVAALGWPVLMAGRG